ncbi:mannose-6-phosphate isomerase-like protein (cupin superfamily) [Mucilaginibacter frigoritolerans]|uniref:Mannose-6-phosphate isomerase-like protein (Cupin superfamily) n=1 Tax=Mucilaginibacter frigoritolerans TaxID=652788 RepID=A0A562U2B0_9SPHI|nr:cupin domain-containing protein [Mucilaginibacter frigoritolerans]TWI99991.1 mannose-6-phosphate isomerase-like protein (cupin superfamily) [Mucilaginibacter frigoritolerans]
MDVQKFIQSGILEEYCLGLLSDEESAYLIQVAMLFPSIKRELTAIEETLEKFSLANAMEPPAETKEKILASLGFADSETLPDIAQMPATDKNTDPKTWLNAAAHLIPENPTTPFTFHQLRKDEHFQQMLIIATTHVPEEEHDNYIESFFILKGYCECTVGNDFFQLGPGDFLEIPLNVKHNVKLTSPCVVAVLQYEFV